MKRETACRFSTCVVRSFLYLDTDFVDILVRVPQCYLFCRRTFFAYFKSVIKISKAGFKKWNCFGKTGSNTSLIVSIIILELKHQLQKWYLVSTNSMYLNERCWFLWAIRNSLWPDPMLRVTAFFFDSIMFHLTSFWVRDNSISLSEHRNLVNIMITNYSLSRLQPALWRTLSVCRVLLWCLLHIIISVNVPLGH